MARSAHESTLAHVAVAKLKESPTNPRQSFGDLNELAGSIRAVGVLEPLLVRPHDGGHEVICGHRRLRAAKLAGLKEVPVVIREMTDREALEAQLVENLQRKDMHPLEEAEAYGRLRDEFGYPAERIAERLGRGRATVFASLKLLDLVPAVRKAFLADKLDASGALLIARLKGEKVQVSALEAIGGPKEDRPRYREAMRIINARFSASKTPPSRKPREVESARGSPNVVNAVLSRARHAIEGRRDMEPFEFKLLVTALADLHPAVLGRRNIGSIESLARVLGKMRPGEIRAMAFELTVAPWLDADADGARLQRLAKAYGTSVRDIERDIDTEEKAAANKDVAESLFKRLGDVRATAR